MKILHLDEQRGWRGGEQQASWLMQGLARRGHDQHIGARKGSAFLTSDHGGIAVQRFPLPLRNEIDVASAWQLARYCREHEIDIVHAHTSHAHLIACLSKWIGGGAKVVVSRRVSFAPDRNPFNRWKYRQPDHFLSVSSKVDCVLAAFGVPADRRSVVYSSIDLGRLEVPPVSRSKLGVVEGAPLLVSAGALVGHKDHDNLLRATALVRRDFPAVQLIIAGEGDLRPALERTMAILQIQDCVRLLGHRDDVPALIRAADVYVSSSWSEGLGTSVLEALACGTPVVATDAGGVPEMVIDGQTGRLVPNRDPEALARGIVASLANREHAQSMAAAGRRLVETRFTPDRMVEATLRVYDRVLARVNKMG